MGEKALYPDHYTLGEYFEIDNASDIKYEFERGKILAMSGGTLNHSRIGGNLFKHVSIKLEAKGSNCETFNSDARLYIPEADSSVHPDLMVICGEVELFQNSQEALLNPCLVIEVLSQSTQGYDRGEKFYKYKSISSLQEYILVDQYQPQIDIYRKTPDGDWLIKSISAEKGEITFSSIGISLSFEEIYQNVSGLA